MTIKRTLVVILGVALAGLGASVQYISYFGISPYNALLVGLSEQSKIGIGTLSLLAQLILAAIVLVLDKSKLWWGTLIPLVGFGYAMEFFNYLFSTLGINFAEQAFYIKFMIFMIGILILSFGGTMYMTVNIGMMPYDGLMFAAESRLNIPSKQVRISQDLFFCLLAFLFKGPLSFGTVIQATCMGYFIAFYREGIIKSFFTIINLIPK